jgi:hypothetical protein
MATQLNLGSLRSVIGFLRASVKVRRQVLASPGALGVSLIAHPFSKRFFTLSAWTDQEAINQFVITQPHRGVMKRYNDKMDQPVFVSWSVPAASLPPTWAEAQQRLASDPNRKVK